MKCPDCNGVIEGRRSFCPHCGRKMGGGIFPAVASQRTINAPKTAQPRILTTGKLMAEDKGLQARTGANPVLVRIATFMLIGALIGSALPGHRWLAGALIGLFLGLPKKVKT